jgi:hypothetical protein
LGALEKHALHTAAFSVEQTVERLREQMAAGRIAL